MKTSIFGMGYVGIVTAVCMSRTHNVVGVDVNEQKIDMINRGESPIEEPEVRELLKAAVGNGKLRATLSCEDAVLDSDVSLICVGTPSDATGKLETRYVLGVCSDICEAASKKDTQHVIVIRSTVPCGTYLEAKKICEGTNVQVSLNPEFLREGSAVADYRDPPFIVVGAESEFTKQCIHDIYCDVNTEFIVVDPKIAELMKVACNAWHATKVVFANEVGRIAVSYDLDSRALMDLLIRDKKLNISERYMRPGFAFGGSCLPKDVRAICALASENAVKAPMLRALSESNQNHIELALRKILDTGKKKIGIVGLAFKPKCDDMRESPSVELAERLIGKGIDIRILDSVVNTSFLMGSNRAYVETHISHLSELLAKPQELLEHAEVIVLCHQSVDSQAVIDGLNPSQVLIDLVGHDTETLAVQSLGLLW